MSKVNYDELTAQARALIHGVPHFVANLANISSLVYHTLNDINWAGFYLADGDKLVLGPFQGKTACIEIPFGKGVCGTAAQQNKTLLVNNVHLFSGHIACDSASQSELVVPIHKNRDVIAVLDIDSPLLNRFNGEDKVGLELLATVLEENLF